MLRLSIFLSLFYFTQLLQAQDKYFILTEINIYGKNNLGFNQKKLPFNEFLLQQVKENKVTIYADLFKENRISASDVADKMKGRDIAFELDEYGNEVEKIYDYVINTPEKLFLIEETIDKGKTVKPVYIGLFFNVNHENNLDGFDPVLFKIPYAEVEKICAANSDAYWFNPLNNADSLLYSSALIEKRFNAARVRLTDQMGNTIVDLDQYINQNADLELLQNIKPKLTFGAGVKVPDQISGKNIYLNKLKSWYYIDFNDSANVGFMSRGSELTTKLIEGILNGELTSYGYITDTGISAFTPAKFKTNITNLYSYNDDAVFDEYYNYKSTVENPEDALTMDQFIQQRKETIFLENMPDSKSLSLCAVYDVKITGPESGTEKIKYYQLILPAWAPENVRGFNVPFASLKATDVNDYLNKKKLYWVNPTNERDSLLMSAALEKRKFRVNFFYAKDIFEIDRVMINSDYPGKGPYNLLYKDNNWIDVIYNPDSSFASLPFEVSYYKKMLKELTLKDSELAFLKTDQKFYARFFLSTTLLKKQESGFHSGHENVVDFLLTKSSEGKILAYSRTDSVQVYSKEEILGFLKAHQADKKNLLEYCIEEVVVIDNTKRIFFPDYIMLLSTDASGEGLYLIFFKYKEALEILKTNKALWKNKNIRDVFTRKVYGGELYYLKDRYGRKADEKMPYRYNKYFPEIK